MGKVFCYIMVKEFTLDIVNEYEDHVIVLHQNIQSICKNFNLFVLKLQCLKKLPKIIILSEIWIEDEEIPFYSLPGYNAYPK